MGKYVEPIVTALTLFPLAAAVFTLPYLIRCYRKYGSVLFMRVVCVYGFILYLMCVGCLAILPFPNADTVVTQKVGLNLIPFSYVPELLTKTVTFSLADPTTWPGALYSSGLYEPLLNIVMFLPLGTFLRYYCGWSRRKTVLGAALLSLFLELTQLTATWGLAPFPYRVCDINDLIDNTLGGFLGYLATPLLTRVLPTRERLNQVSYQRGARVSYVRRAFAFAVDAVLLNLLALALDLILPQGVGFVAAVALYGGALPALWAGKTPGNALVRIRSVDDRTRQTARFHQYLLRNGALHLLFLRIDLLLRPFATGNNAQTGAEAMSLVMAGLLFLCAIWHAVHNEPQMGYEEWTHTLLVSTVALPGQTPKSAANLDGTAPQE